MVAQAGEIRPSRAAKLLKVHYRTVMRWIHRRVAGQDSPITTVRRDVVGGYYLLRAEVVALRERAADEPADFS